MKGNQVYLAGAFENECILDIQTAFEAIELEYTRIPELIV